MATRTYADALEALKTIILDEEEARESDLESGFAWYSPEVTDREKKIVVLKEILGALILAQEPITEDTPKPVRIWGEHPLPNYPG